MGSIGLLSPARRVKQSMCTLKIRAQNAIHAAGWGQWQALVPIDSFMSSCELAIRALREKNHEFGDYLEFGVSRGTSMACMYHALRNSGLTDARLFGFDSFEGMPDEASEQGWLPGQYASTIGATRRYLKTMGVNLRNFRLIKGWFKESLTAATIERFNLRRASIIMVDCDIYSASKEALWFCAPLIAKEAVIIFDDWGWRADNNQIGQQEAYAEFLEAFPHFQSLSLEPAHIPQARIFLLTRHNPQRETPASGPATS